MPFPRIVKPVPARLDDILDAAQLLFGEQGYDATSISQIVARLGISKGGFYHYFDSKEALLEALARRYALRTAAQAATMLSDPAQDAFSKLSAFLSAMRSQKAANVSELRATFEPLFRQENLQLFEKTQRAVDEVVRPILTRIIAEGIAERTFDTPDAENAAETIMHLMSAHRGLLCALFSTRNPLEFRRLSERLLAKATYMASVMDRILGLPEGSIELADRSTLDSLACTLDPEPSAA